MLCISSMFLLAQSAVAQQQNKPDTVTAQLTAQISETSATPFFFAVVTGYAIDAASNVYVSDGQETRVAVFSSGGKPLGTIGRKGKGPGEFEYPTGPVIGADGALYIRNMSLVQRFVSNPKTGLLSTFDRQFTGPAFAPWMSKQATIIDRSSRLYFPLEWGSRDRMAHFAYKRYALDGAPRDSLDVPMQPTSRSITASVTVSPGSGRMVQGLNVVPFHPQPVFTVTATGTILSSASNSYQLQETDVTGRVVRTITRATSALKIPPNERADSAKALARRIDSLTVPLSQVNGVSDEVKTRTLPTTYPVFRSLSTAHDGTIWARRWDSTNRARPISTFDVLAESGAYVRTVIVPANCATLPAPVIRRDLFVCVQRDLDTDAETVVLARIPPRTTRGR
jgi:hypothetical protein